MSKTCYFWELGADLLTNSPTFVEAGGLDIPEAGLYELEWGYTAQAYGYVGYRVRLARPYLEQVFSKDPPVAGEVSPTMQFTSGQLWLKENTKVVVEFRSTGRIAYPSSHVPHINISSAHLTATRVETPYSMALALMKEMSPAERRKLQSEFAELRKAAV